jgi:hypothetical protein
VVRIARVSSTSGCWSSGEDRKPLMSRQTPSENSHAAMAATGGDLSGVGQGCDEDFEFEFALDLLLDGAERLRRRGWRPADRGRRASRIV